MLDFALITKYALLFVTCKRFDAVIAVIAIYAFIKFPARKKLHQLREHCLTLFHYRLLIISVGWIGYSVPWECIENRQEPLYSLIVMPFGGTLKC